MSDKATPTPTTKAVGLDELRGKIAFTLQESGVYPYPQFINPLLQLFEAALGEREREARIDELRKAMEDYGLPEGISYNSTPVVTYRAIRNRIERLAAPKDSEGEKE